MLFVHISGRDKRKIGLSIASVENRDIAVGVTASDEMRLFLRKLAARNAMVGSNDALRELRVL